MSSTMTDIVEALVFASGTPVAEKDILDKVDGLNKKSLAKAIEELKAKYSKEHSGVVLLEFNEKLQFSTNPVYGETVADILTPLKEKELTKTLLEVLATIAYKQPITRLELDDMRGVSSEYALAALLKANLIEVVGRKDTVGRPQLYGTTDEFLKKFELTSLQSLPDLVEVMEKIKLIYAPAGETLFHQRSIFGDGETGALAAADVQADEERERLDKAIDDSEEEGDVKPLIDVENTEEKEPDDDEEIPDFLEGDEDVKVIE